MKTIFNKIMLAAVFALGLTACDKDFKDDLVKDNQPAIPVTYTGATTVGFNPYYTVAVSGSGEIKAVLEIPATATAKIKEVSKIIGGGTGLTVKNLNEDASYIAAPIVVNGTSVTFTTSITEFNSKVPAANRVPATVTGAFTERAFYFKLTMDDGSEIVPIQLRVRFVN